jgi:hypothetical protein
MSAPRLIAKLTKWPTFLGRLAFELVIARKLPFVDSTRALCVLVPD